ncbi:MAG: hypothetical protein DHS20C18_34740 [Saprospiraceae bacterium]|nr:MAG: hypothetical protein DHS20C18_34740 [Saprospiraceae bacterium]
MKDGLAKMTILAYDNRTLTGKEANRFDVPINPETYSRNVKLKYDKTQGLGSQGNNEEFLSTEPESIKFDFIFDNTGTVQGNILDGTPVNDQIEEFLKVTARLNNGRHCPYLLKIVWGDLVFSCQLNDVAINYTLFNPAGEPIRAKLSTTFNEYLHPVKRVQQEDKSSPDLTHLRMVKDEDNLQLMTYDIYNDTKLLLQIAKANGLTSPRLLQVGQELQFPPIQKTEK